MTEFDTRISERERRVKAEAQKAYEMSPECGEMALLRCCVIANRNAASHLSGEGAALKGGEGLPF